VKKSGAMRTLHRAAHSAFVQARIECMWACNGGPIIGTPPNNYNAPDRCLLDKIASSFYFLDSK
jgi:hypothetical protein